jgi:hypothetical protein
MPNQFDKLFGPKPPDQTPSKQRLLQPTNVHRTYSTWPYISVSPAKSLLPRIRSENRPLGQ